MTPAAAAIRSPASRKRAVRPRADLADHARCCASRWRGRSSRSGLTRWDDWFTLSFGTKILFSQEYKLHIFGSEIPFPAPELVATLASTAEIVLPILLAFGLLTRYAALGLLGMTAVIQLTYPDGWANFHLPWAVMAVAILVLGPGRVSLDALIGLDGRQGRV